MAKIVLDEIAQRLKLIEELQMRTRDERSREVQDLQPLFKRSLWIFGPEFETIEYTSNSGMTRVIQDLFHSSCRERCNGLTLSYSRTPSRSLRVPVLRRRGSGGRC
jgi:hypothetical protein